MRFLLDTHTYLWLVREPGRIPNSVFSVLEDDRNRFYLSILSLWEMTIKSSRGKLQLPGGDIASMLQEIEAFPISLIAIEPEGLPFLGQLPWIHKDPFDRLLIAQAKRHSLTILTNDNFVQQYDVACLWA